MLKSDAVVLCFQAILPPHLLPMWTLSFVIELHLNLSFAPVIIT